jgi:hypothetical protein
VKIAEQLTTRSVKEHRDHNGFMRLQGSREPSVLYSIHQVLIDILEELREQSEWVKGRAGE